MAVLQHHFFDYQTHSIHYVRIGTGKQVLIALHGYGISAVAFAILEKTLGAHYTIYALDMPFHGKTEWNADDFSRIEILELVAALIEKTKTTNFELLGYSYGGRMAALIAPHFSKEITRLWLVASDGLYVRLGYNLPIYPKAFRRSMAKLLAKPDRLIAFLERLYEYGLFPKYTLRFMQRNVSSEVHRKRLLNTWISLRDFVLYPRKQRQILAQMPFEVTFIYGTKDTIISPKGGQKMVKKMPNATLHFIEGDHRILGDNLGNLMRSLDKTD